MPRKGGEAGKAGDTYEYRWVVRYMLDLLLGRVVSIQHEPASDAIDLLIVRNDLTRENIQAKRGTTESRWGISRLRNVLASFHRIVTSEPTTVCTFVSANSVHVVSEIADRAGKSADLADFMTCGMTSGLMRKTFDEMRKICIASEEEMYFSIRRMKFVTIDEQELFRQICDSAMLVVPTLHPENINSFFTDIAMASVGRVITYEWLANELEAKHRIRVEIPPNERAAGVLIQKIEEQADSRMKRLRSTDLHSGKKYIPQLYIERREPLAALQSSLADPSQRVILLVGPPQVGKTNFICHAIEKLMREGYLCLFFPAISMRRGVIEELCNDLCVGDAQIHTIMHKIERAASMKGNRPVVIFVDGWNEASRSVASLLDEQAPQLSNVRLVISFSNTAATRLLKDLAGNTGNIADSVGASSGAVDLIEMDLQRFAEANSSAGIVVIGRYTEEERDAAYCRYAELYNVFVPSNHTKTRDPYILAIGMATYKEGALPERLDEPTLIAESLRRRAERTGMRPQMVLTALIHITRLMLSHGCPLAQEHSFDVLRSFDDAAVSSFFDNALLVEVTSGASLIRSLDFYYERDRAFLVAGHCFSWGASPPPLTDQSFLDALSSHIGREALRWYWRHSFERISFYTDGVAVEVQEFFLETTLQLAAEGSDVESVYTHLHAISSFGATSRLRILAIRVALYIAEDRDQLIDLVGDVGEFATAVLGLADEKFSFVELSSGSVVLDAFEWLHREEMGESELPRILVERVRVPSQQRGALQCLARIEPWLFLRELAHRGPTISGKIRADFGSALANARETLQEIYYGSYCPGYLDAIGDDPEELLTEYVSHAEELMAVIDLFPDEARFFRDLLEVFATAAPEKSKDLADDKTLMLPFFDDVE